MAAAILADALLQRKPGGDAAVGRRTKTLRRRGWCDSVAGMAAPVPGA
jgi:hypothetical protein